jgi:hypothetical protein
MVNLSPAYEPVIIKGLTVHKDNPFLFDFIVDVGQDKMSGEPLKKEGEKLIKYFLASLAIPDKDVWVNLSPYERNKMIPEVLGQTDMGRDLLEQDYILKQITASLIYPEKQLGKTFWDKVYSKAQQMYGTTQVPVNTFNKVWIMADRAEVFEHNQTAFVVDSHLKVMLEEDYLALCKNECRGGSCIRPITGPTQGRPLQNDVHSLGSQMVRTIILPELEKEVNTGKNFANLRQIFNSIILSSWYKKNLKQALLNQVYADKSKVKGVIASEAKQSREQIYEQYLKAYKKGVFNYIKEEPVSKGTTIPRKYFSGGVDEAMAANPKITTDLVIGAEEMSRQHFNKLFDLAMFASTEGERKDVLLNKRAWKTILAPSNFKKIGLKVNFEKLSEISTGLLDFSKAFLEIPIALDDRETQDALQRLIGLTLPKGSMLFYKEAKFILVTDTKLRMFFQGILFTGDGHSIYFISLKNGRAFKDGPTFAEVYLKSKSFPRDNFFPFINLTGVILNINSKEFTIQLDDVIEAKVKNPDQGSYAGHSVLIPDARRSSQELAISKGKTIPRKHFSGDTNETMALKPKTTTNLVMGVEAMARQYFYKLVGLKTFTATKSKRNDVLLNETAGMNIPAPLNFKKISLKENFEEMKVGSAELAGSGTVSFREIPIILNDEETRNALQGLIDLTHPDGKLSYKEAKFIFARDARQDLISQDILFTSDGHPIHFISFKNGPTLKDVPTFEEVYLKSKSFPRGNFSSFTNLTGVMLNNNSKEEVTIKLDEVMEGKEELAKLSKDDVEILTILTQNVFKNQIDLARAANDIERMKELVSEIVFGMFEEQRPQLAKALTYIFMKDWTVEAVVQKARSDQAMMQENDKTALGWYYNNLIEFRNICQKLEDHFKSSDPSYNGDYYMGQKEEMKRLYRALIADFSPTLKDSYSDLYNIHEKLDNLTHKLAEGSFLTDVSKKPSPEELEVISELLSISQQEVKVLKNILRKGQAVKAVVKKEELLSAMTGRLSDVIHVMTLEEIKYNLVRTPLKDKYLVSGWSVVLEKHRSRFTISVWHKEDWYPFLSINIPGTEKFAKRVFDSALKENLDGLAQKSAFSKGKVDKEKVLKLIKAVATKECVKELYDLEDGILKNLNNEAIVRENLSTIIDEFISTGLIQNSLIRLAVDHSLWRIFQNKETRKQAINLISEKPEENSYARRTLIFVLGRFIKQDEKEGKLVQDINDEEVSDNILSNPPTQSRDFELITRILDRSDKAALAKLPQASDAFTRGGIDLNTSNGMQWKVSKDGQGVEMNINPAMIERIRREGIDSLSPVILKITPIASVWPLVGLRAPAQEEHLD